MKILFYEFKRLTNVRFIAFTAIIFALLLGYFYRGVTLHEKFTENSSKFQNSSAEEIRLIPPAMAGILVPEQYSSVLKIGITDSGKTEIVQNVTDSSLQLINNFALFLFVFFAVFFYTGTTFCSIRYLREHKAFGPFKVLLRLAVRFILQNSLVLIVITLSASIAVISNGLGFQDMERSFIFEFLLLMSIVNLLFFGAGILSSYMVKEHRHRNTILTVTAAILLFVAPVISNFVLPTGVIATDSVNSEREVLIKSGSGTMVNKIKKLNQKFHDNKLGDIASYESAIICSPVSYMINFIESGSGKCSRSRLDFIKYCNNINLKKIEAGEYRENIPATWNSRVYYPSGISSARFFYSAVALLLMGAVLFIVNSEKKKLTLKLDTEALDSSIKYLLEEGGAFGFLKAEAVETSAITDYIASEYGYLRWSHIKKSDWPGNMSVFEILEFLNLNFDRDRAVELAVKNNIHFSSEDMAKQTYSAKLVMASKERLNLRAEDFRKKIGSLDEDKIVKLIGCCFMTTRFDKLIFEDIFVNIKERDITFFKDFFKKVAEQEGKYILYVGSEYFPVFDPLQFADNSNNPYPVHKETKSFTRH